MKEKLLVVDDEPSILRATQRYLSAQGFEVKTAQNYHHAQKILESGEVELGLIDLRLGKDNGIELVKRFQNKSVPLSFIIMTGHASIETAIHAVKAGAFHYVTKPFEFEDLLNLIHKALEHQKILCENHLLKKQLKSKMASKNILGISEGIKEVYHYVERVADTNSTVLILGESGTGKELVARAIHQNSSRADQPLVPVNCGAIPDTLLESELFGHVRGAFTGAIANRSGKFEQAQGGTLFLDEIGEMPHPLQVKLLRAVQERKFESVGSNRTIEVDVRIIAATNQNLSEAVKQGHFREDLFYRLNVIPIRIPPLRQRIEDIPILMDHFVIQFSTQYGTEAPTFKEDCRQALLAYTWPGNVRELENLMERLVILYAGRQIAAKDLPGSISQNQNASYPQVQIPEGGLCLRSMLENYENEIILKALEKTAWNKNKAAALLQVNRTTLVEKIKRKQLSGELHS